MIVYKITQGEERSIAIARPRELHFTFLCDMGLPCSTSNKYIG